MLEDSKGHIIINGLGTFNSEDYFQYIQAQGIIEDKETDVIDNGDGTYDVTTNLGYIFLVELMPTRENPIDAKIEYLGQAGKIAPIIKKIETGATSTSITAKAIVVRLGSGTVTYYYKLASAYDNEYQEITNVTEENGATQNTGITAGEKYIIKVVAKNEIEEVSKTVEVTIKDEITATWEEINKMAKEIANDDSITNDSSQATVTIDGESKTIKVGETYKVKYGSEEKRVRVLGFKHDDLVNTGVYEGNHSKASISFEFLHFITGNTFKSMNSSNRNSGGWANTEMRTFLNGEEGKAELSNKEYIKQVKKKYIATYNDANSVTTCNDYLWLLSASEIVNDRTSKWILCICNNIRRKSV